jgi:O-succinylbenzoate synthase
VLKPSLHGGISGCNEWIELANERSIGWWITSYLESNIGLNAIAQWAFTKNTKMHQGLGTGRLFTNNIESPLEIRGEKLWFNSAKTFEM